MAGLLSVLCAGCVGAVDDGVIAGRKDVPAGNRPCDRRRHARAVRPIRTGTLRQQAETQGLTVPYAAMLVQLRTRERRLHLELFDQPARSWQLGTFGTFTEAP
jgi:hypothetical protein